MCGRTRCGSYFLNELVRLVRGMQIWIKSSKDPVRAPAPYIPALSTSAGKVLLSTARMQRRFRVDGVAHGVDVA